MSHNIYLTLLLSLLFINCSSDSSNMDDGGEKFTVVGTWKLTSYTFENSYDFNQDGKSSNDFMLETACFDDITMILNADGTGETIASTQLDFTFSGPNEYTMNCSSDAVTDAITWELEGDILTIQGSVQGYSVTIEGNTFSYSRNADQLVQVLFDPSFKDNETVVYTKQ